MEVLSLIVGSVIALAGIVVSLVIAKRPTEFKAIDYELDSDISLWQADAEDVMTSKIELRYEGRELHHPRFIDVTVKNTGTKEVLKEDYHRPIVFQLEDNIAPVDARITAQHPDNIVDDIFETQPNGVRAISITPILMNPGDWFKLRMLFNHADVKLEASHRIVGAGPMREYSLDQLRAQIRFTRPMLVICLLAFVAGAIVMVRLTLREITQGNVGSPVMSLIFGPLLGGMLAGMAAMLAVLGWSAIYMKFFYR